MKKTTFGKMLALLVCMVLIAAMALCVIGCDKEADNKETPQTQEPTATAMSEATAESGATQDPAGDGENVLGEGSTQFTFTVIDAEGKETTFQIKTDKKTVGEALQELGLLAGEEGAYGLYVKTVNGVTVDYDTDGKYWAFYINGKYGMSGVDVTEITAGATYSFKVE